MNGRGAFRHLVRLSKLRDFGWHSGDEASAANVSSGSPCKALHSGPLQPVAGSRSAARKLSVIPSTVDEAAERPVGKFDALRP